MSTFVIRNVQEGPQELRAQLPRTASTLRCLTDHDGRGEFWCAQLEEPLKYRINADFDTRRCQPEFLGHDETGPFVWIQIIVVQARGEGRLHAGMRHLPVDLSYVVDLTLGQDPVLDPAKIATVAVVDIDDADPDAAAPTPEPQPEAEHLEPVSAEDFSVQLNQLVAVLATLTGQHPGLDGVPEPVEARRGHGRRVYDLGSTPLRYYTYNRTVRRWQWRITSDPDELLYWILEEIASGLAWAWAQKAPSYKTMDERRAREVLWMPQWQSLMTALNVEWGNRTGDRIRALRSEKITLPSSTN